MPGMLDFVYTRMSRTGQGNQLLRSADRNTTYSHSTKRSEPVAIKASGSVECASEAVILTSKARQEFCETKTMVRFEFEGITL